jgi:hypothetical protein
MRFPDERSCTIREATADSASQRPVPTPIFMRSAQGLSQGLSVQELTMILLLACPIILKYLSLVIQPGTELVEMGGLHTFQGWFQTRRQYE